VSALRRLIAGYRETWTASGPGGQAILIGTLAFIARVIGSSFLLPLYAKASGYSSGDYGLLFAVQSSLSIVSLPPILYLARRGLDRRLMMIGPVIGATGLLVLALSRDAPFGFWLVGALLAGGSSTTYWTLSDPLLSEATESEHRPQAFALKWLFFTVGSSIGALAAGAVPDVLRSVGGLAERDAYWAMLFPLIGLDLLQVRIFRRAPQRAMGTRADGLLEPRIPFRVIGRSLLLLGLAEAAFGLGYSTIRPFMSLFLTEREGLSSGGAGAVIASTAVFAAIGGLLMPTLAQRFGNTWSLAGLRLAGAAAVAAWFMVGELGAVIALTLLYYGLVDGTSALYAAEVMGRLPAAARDLMAGLNNVLWSAVGAGAAALSGFLQDHPSGGFGTAFSVGVAGYMLSAAACAIILPRVILRSALERPNREQSILRGDA
jgi:MFS family permease